MAHPDSNLQSTDSHPSSGTSTPLQPLQQNTSFNSLPYSSIYSDSKPTIRVNNENEGPSTSGEHYSDENRTAFNRVSLSGGSTPLDSLNSSVLSIQTTTLDPPTIVQDAAFTSYELFEKAFKNWKNTFYHPFRVASSETLKDPDGNICRMFRYRYAVYHCAHYGEPRMRGAGKRPNQSYMPCGCQAMLRLNYKFNERLLRVTTLIDEHNGHSLSADNYARSSSKNGKGGRMRKSRPMKGGDSSSVSPASQLESPSSDSHSMTSQSSPAMSTGTPVPSFNPMLMQQQFLNAILAASAHNQEQQMNPPGMVNLFNIMPLPFIQPAHGLMAPISASMPPQPVGTVTESSPEFKIPQDLPAPIPIKVMAVKQEPEVQHSGQFLQEELQKTIKDIYEYAIADISKMSQRYETLRKIRDEWKC